LSIWASPKTTTSKLDSPAVIFQTDDLSRLNTVVIIPLTTQLKRSGFASTVLIPAKEAGLDHPSVALCHQIRVIDCRKLKNKIGELSLERLSEIEITVVFVLGIPS